MNRFESAGFGEAKIKYLDGDYRLISAGNYVTCAVTGRQIPLDELKYWNVDRQEAYVDVAAAVKRAQETEDG